MIRTFFAFILLVTLSATPLNARHGCGAEGFGWGMFGGFLGGTIASQIAANNNPSTTVVVYEDPYAEQKRMEMQAREDAIRSREFEQRQREAYEAHRRQEDYQRELAQKNRQPKNNVLVENTIIETRTVAHPQSKDKTLALHERELALKEQETKLAILKEKNKEKELELKEKELDLALAKAQKHSNGGVEKTITQKISKRSLTDDEFMHLAA